MRRWLSPFGRMDEQHRANGLAGTVVLLTVGILYLDRPPVPAGAESPRPLMAAVHRRPLIAVAKLDVPARPAAELAAPDAAPQDTPSTPEQLAAQTLRRKVALLEQGRKFLEQIPDYTCQFSKQELVGGELTDEQCIDMKVRHAPFSVYLKWHTGDEGREVLYVDGENDGKMVVHGGGWKARLPALTIDPEGTLAMGEARYPVTKAGLMELVKLMLSFHATDLSTHNFVRCDQLPDEEFDGRPCHSFEIEYRNAQLSPQYRKSVTLIDKEWNVPVYTQNYGWPDARDAGQDPEAVDEATLIEFYTYAGIQFRQQLAQADFDRGNEDYRFR
jgi:hypothetical protein